MPKSLCILYIRMSLPNDSHWELAQLLEGLAHNPLELQSGCSVHYNDTQFRDTYIQHTTKNLMHCTIPN